MTATITRRRGPGRPRREDLAARAIEATTELLVERGAEGVTIDAIVARSGVSRAALYRRWMSREHLIVDALDAHRGDAVIADTGDLVADLLAGYRLTRPDEENATELLRTRLVLALQHPSLQRKYWQDHVRRRRRPAISRIEAAVARGELPDTDVEDLLDVVNGVYYYQLVVRGEDLDDPATHERIARALRLVLR